MTVRARFGKHVVTGPFKVTDAGTFHPARGGDDEWGIYVTNYMFEAPVADVSWTHDA